MVFNLCFLSCREKENHELASKVNTPIEKANWLIAAWGNTTKEGNLTETWTKQNDSTLVGESFLIKDNDTLFSENMLIAQKDDSLYYIPTVKNQNEGKPVSFQLTSITDNTLVFENPKHDFPQKITYTKITNDSLVAEISGIQNGKEGKESYPMKKI